VLEDHAASIFTAEKFLEMKTIDLNGVCVLCHVPIVFVGGGEGGVVNTRFCCAVHTVLE